MGKQIIKQPDGQFAIFCSNTDTITMWDASAGEVIDWFADRAREDAWQHAHRIVQLVESGDSRKAYFQFAMTWDEALEEDREHGGEAWREFTSQPGVPTTQGEQDG